MLMYSLDICKLYTIILLVCFYLDISCEVNVMRKRRFKRFDLYTENFWKIRNFTYTIGPYSKQLNKTDVDNCISRAFHLWEQNSGLSFYPGNKNDSYLSLGFYNIYHGDNRSFNRYSTTIAHTFPPPIGIVRFNDGHIWSVDIFCQVALHEVGHLFGLKDSKVLGSLMFPVIMENNRGELHADDIVGIQALYGPRNNTLPKLLPNHDYLSLANDRYNSAFEICQNAYVDAIFTRDGYVFTVFRDRYFYEVAINGLIVGYPRRISDIWAEIDGYVNASFYHNNKLYLFTDTQVFRYTGFDIDDGYPKNISNVFPGIPNDLNACVLDKKLQSIFFIKNRIYWQFPLEMIDSTRLFELKNDSMLLPGKIDAVVEDILNRTYIFIDGNFFQSTGFIYAKKFLEIKQFRIRLPFIRQTVSKHFLNCNE